MSLVLAVSIGGAALLVLLVVGVELTLREQRAGYLGAKPQKLEREAPPVDESSGRAYLRIPTEQHIALAKGSLGELDATLLERRASLDILDTLERAGYAATPPKPTIPQQRRVRVAYSRRKYIGQAFPVKVTIGAGGLVSLGRLPRYLEQAKAETLAFMAYEQTPQIQVELRFAASEFNVNRTKITKTLPEHQATDFDFLVKPLKAEDCILTVVISYLSAQTIPEHPTQRTTTRRDVTDGAGRETSHEQGEETVIALASPATQVTPVWSADLIVSVTQIFGMNAGTVNALRAVFGVVAAGLAIAFALSARQIDTGTAIVAGALAVFDVFFSPGVDVAKTLLTNKQV